MRRFLSLFTVLMLCGVLAYAQSRVVSGRVTDENGNPVPFATVTVNGTRTGLSADANGQYTIRVKDGEVLSISGTGYVATNVNVGTLTNITTVLQKDAKNVLTEVVVTSAFQTKRAARSTASNVQFVSGEQLAVVRQTNVNDALAGKIAGAQVRSQSVAKLGTDETVVRLRGENGLGVGSGPIYVVDGTIVPSANDINNDDVENITVLQGPASAALFGPDGANGAIVITTKRAKKNTSNIEINSGVTFDEVYVLPQYQNAYAGGSGQNMFRFTYVAGMPEGWKALDGKYYHNYDDDASWGPRMVGQEYIPWYAWYAGSEYSFKTAKLTPQPNNIKDFYNTGVTSTNNVSFAKATDNTNFRVSYTNLDIKGLIPNSYLKRNTLNANFSADLTPRFTVSTSINYINQKRNAESDDNYSNASSGSFGQWFHRELDMNIMKELRYLTTPSGVYANWNHGNPETYSTSNPDKFYKSNYWINPYVYFDKVKNYNSRDRLFGDASVSYKITNDLKAKATYRRQQLTTNGYNIYPTELQVSGIQVGFNPYAQTTAEGALAAYQTGQSYSVRQYYEGLLSYNHKFKDFAVNANGGFVIYKSSARSFNANTSGGLIIPNVYSLANSVNPLRNAGSLQLETITEYKSRALFISGDVGYKNFAFLEGTYRRDYASAEPKNFYIETKSAGASFVFSDLIKAKNILSYGKIRASVGQVLNSLGAYELGTYYTITDNYGVNSIMTVPNTFPDATLHGAVNNEKEIGMELRFLKNRIGISGTYWTRVNKDFPVSVTVPQSTGISQTRLNAGEISKKGIDLQFNAQIFKSKNFDWNLTATWGRLLENKVVSIYPGITRLVSANGSYGPTTSNPISAWTVSEIGQEWGQLHGTGIKRINGQPVLNSDGLYVSQADVNYGSVLPDYTGGVQSSFNIFKNFIVNVNIDFSYGGKFFSLADYWGTFSGLTQRTATLNDKGNSIRDAVADGGGVHVFGVDGTGKPVDYYVEAQDYFQQYYTSKISEANVYDLTFVKMRELSFGYRVPVEKMRIGKFLKNATLSVTARNPWLIYRKAKDFDPSEISAVQGEEGQFPGTRSIGFNLKLGF